MPIEICAVGGYGEVGKSMTAVNVDGEVVIFDVGLHMPNYIKYTEEEPTELKKLSRKELIKAKAIPDDSIIEEWREKVVAIVPSHAHMDHIGAVPYIAPRYDAPIICTPFAAEVLKAIVKDQDIEMPNEIKPLNVNSSIKLTENLKLEFINMTHSTPQTIVAALHTKYGAILYSNEFKLDNTPTLGQKPNYEALQKLSEKGIKAEIVDALYAHEAIKMPSESVAKEMLRDVLFGLDTKGKGIIITTFSSHIARIKSAIDFAKKLNRKVVILGRSLTKYCTAAENSGVFNFSKEGVEIIKYPKAVMRSLDKIQKEGKEKYLILMTGHQGEPNALLSKIADGKIDFKLDGNDHIIFSCNTIPTPINIEHRKKLEDKLKTFGVRMFKGIHISGHGAREDIRDLINLTKPEVLLPANSEKHNIEQFQNLAKELGYQEGKNMFSLLTGSRIKLDK